MADLRLVWNPSRQCCDWTVVADAGGRGDLAADAQLESVILLLLFTWARAAPDYVLTDGTNDRKGWWGDDFADPAYPIGSRLWQLLRRKIDNRAALEAEARGMMDEALARLKDWGLATAVSCSASCPPAGIGNSGNVLILFARISRPAAPPLSLSYTYRLS